MQGVPSSNLGVPTNHYAIDTVANSLATGQATAAHIGKPFLDLGAPLPTIPALFDGAGIAQLVERNLAKVEVASSSLVSRSTLNLRLGGRVVMQRPAKPRTAVRFRS